MARRSVRQLWCAAVLALGCQQEAVYPIVGPDGSGMVHVSCEDSGRCYQIAGGLCPYGYDLWLAVGEDGRNVLVRCRVAHALVVPPVVASSPPPPLPVASAPPPPPPPVVGRPTESVSDSAPAAEQPWPPAAEPGVWPNASSGSTWPPKPEHATKPDAPASYDVGY